jgi:hypothetical protein
VTIIRLVAAGTVEEQILDLHADKRALVAGVLDGADVAARLDVDQMVSLLRRGWTGGDADDDGPADVPATPPAPRTRITITPAPAAVPASAELVPVPGAVSTPAEPGDVPLPAWTGGSAARFQQHVDAFVADVEKRGGRTMGHGPCVKRFASTLVARARAGQEVELGPWLAVDTYVRDMNEGRVDVPAAEKKHTAAALAAFMKFLAQRTGA